MNKLKNLCNYNIKYYLIYVGRKETQVSQTNINCNSWPRSKEVQITAKITDYNKL